MLRGRECGLVAVNALRTDVDLPRTALDRCCQAPGNTSPQKAGCTSWATSRRRFHPNYVEEIRFIPLCYRHPVNACYPKSVLLDGSKAPGRSMTRSMNPDQNQVYNCQLRPLVDR